jgi:hypothetical protein
VIINNVFLKVDTGKIDRKEGGAMLKRLGAVGWWFGAAVIVLAAVLWTWGKIEHRGCAEILRLNAEINAAHDAAMARYEKTHPARDQVLSELDAVANVPRDRRNTESFQQTVRDCRNVSYSYIGLMFAGLITLILWSLAFVLGGSFWRPPRLDRKLP